MADEVKLIDADKLIGYLQERYFWDDDDRDMVFKAIEEQPTIESEPVNGWISVDDRLPEEMEPVIVTVTYADGHTESTAAHYLSYDYGWEAEDSQENLRDKDIKWWRSYPEPPKEG